MGSRYNPFELIRCIFLVFFLFSALHLFLEGSLFLRIIAIGERRVGVFGINVLEMRLLSGRVARGLERNVMTEHMLMESIAAIWRTICFLNVRKRLEVTEMIWTVERSQLEVNADLAVD